MYKNNLFKLMSMTTSELKDELKRLAKQLNDSLNDKAYMLDTFDLDDTDDYLEYTELCDSIEYIEDEIEAIDDYFTNYDYYWE